MSTPTTTPAPLSSVSDVWCRQHGHLGRFRTEAGAERRAKLHRTADWPRDPDLECEIRVTAERDGEPDW